MKKLYFYISHGFTFLVALQILNMSLFVQDFQQFVCSSPSFSERNIINSVVEYISEVVLENVNMVPENNNKANKDLLAHKHFTFKMIEVKKLKLIITPAGIKAQQVSPFRNTYSYHFFKEINPPPPKA